MVKRATLPSSGQEWNSCIPPRFLHQVCRGRRGKVYSVPYGYELGPVATETSRVDASVHDEPPVGTASGFVSQGDACLTLSDVVADIDDLHQQQVEEPTSHDAAVPCTGEAKRSTGTQTRREGKCK